MPQHSAMGESTENGLMLPLEAFLDALESVWKDFTSDESRPAPLVCLAVIDQARRHRDKLGFRRRSELVRQLAGRIRENMEFDGSVALAGDSSVAVLVDPASSQPPVREWADRLLQLLNARLYEVSGQSVSVSVSLGIYPLQGGESSAEEPLLRAARLAETASANGGGRARVYQSRRGGAQSATDNRTLLQLLSQALQNNRVRVLFQPLVAIDGDESPRHQILPRLQAADDALVPASRFVPLAARYGMLQALDRWMLAWSLQYLEQREGSGRPTLFLNQSPALLDDSDLVGWLEKRLLARPEIAAGLVLEFRMEDLLERLDQAPHALEKLSGLGVATGVTGVDEDASAELLLDHLKTQYLRMGPGFAHRMVTDNSLAERYEEFARRAQENGRRLIIPMLENADDAARIWRSRVDLIQGNFIQRPAEETG